MKLEGIHHITCITADAPRNVDFYARLLGLRMVKKTVNQDDPSVYHLFYADEEGSPGADLTFFEFPGVPVAGRATAWCTGSPGVWPRPTRSISGHSGWATRDTIRARRRPAALQRLRGPRARAGRGRRAGPAADRRASRDPAELALQGFDGVRAYAADPERSRPLLEEALAFEPRGRRMGGARRAPRRPLRLRPAARRSAGLQGAGTVHHVAWASHDDEHESWRERVMAAGAHPTPVIDRFWFRSIYFREPSGVLFELATFSPGFAADEAPEHLGESLVLPPFLESRREEIEARLTPVENPRVRAARRASSRDERRQPGAGGVRPRASRGADRTTGRMSDLQPSTT